MSGAATNATLPPVSDTGPSIDEQLAAVSSGIYTLWVLSCVIFVFLMQAGFSFLEAGGVRAENVQNVIFKNMGDCCIGAMCWYACGYGLAFGVDNDTPKQPFAGDADFFLATHGEFAQDRMAHWLLSYVYMTTAGTIISGAIAERVKLLSYYFINIIVAGVSYPIGAHWIWGAEGWLSPWNSDRVAANGVLDFAGSIVIHMSGGIAALTCAIVIGHRKLPGGHSPFTAEGSRLVVPHNKFSVAVGTLLLWTSWFAFNAGSVVSIESGGSGVAANACLTTAVAGACAALTGLLTSKLFLGFLELCHVCNCLLSGLVAITASCAFVAPHLAIVIGFIAAWLYTAASYLRIRFEIDDVIDAFAVHGVNGAWGGLAVGLFADPVRIRSGTGEQGLGRGDDYGLFLGGSAKQLGVQLLGVVSVAAWSASVLLIVCFTLKKFEVLRVSLREELEGLDWAEHFCGAFDWMQDYRHDPTDDMDVYGEGAMSPQSPDPVMAFGAHEEAVTERTPSPKASKYAVGAEPEGRYDEHHMPMAEGDSVVEMGSVSMGQSGHNLVRRASTAASGFGDPGLARSASEREKKTSATWGLGDTRRIGNHSSADLLFDDDGSGSEREATEAAELEPPQHYKLVVGGFSFFLMFLLVLIPEIELDKRGEEVSSGSKLEQIQGDLGATWMLICVVFVFMMQAGFSFLEAGGVRAENAQNVIFKNVGDCCIGALCWWATGYGLAFGQDADTGTKPFAGDADFFLFSHGDFPMSRMAHWMLSYVYMTTAGTIISGAIAERVALGAYYCIIIVIACVSYPVGCHWIWGAEGWLSPWNPDRVAGNGVLDFAGSIVIHMTGGVTALVGAKIIGPRRLPGGVDVFSEEGEFVCIPHNKFSCAVGTLLLWTSWFAFNAGSVVGMSPGSEIAANACLTTLLAGAAAAVTGLISSYFLFGFVELCHVCNCLLAGLVAITAGCAYVAPEYAVIIGTISAFCYTYAVRFRKWMRVDDVIDAFAVHGVNGAFGGICVGLFADAERIRGGTGDATLGKDEGLFIGGEFTQLGVQCLGIVAAAAWSAAVMTIITGTLKVIGVLRVSLDEELSGLDIAEHRSSAYEYLATIRADRNLADGIVAIGTEVCGKLVDFDLAGAKRTIEDVRSNLPRRHRGGILTYFDDLTANLGRYRPYLPDSLFLQQEEEDAASTPKSQRSQRTDKSSLHASSRGSVMTKGGGKSFFKNRNKRSSSQGSIFTSVSTPGKPKDKIQAKVKSALGLSQVRAAVLDFDVREAKPGTVKETMLVNSMLTFADAAQEIIKSEKGTVERLGCLRIIASWGTVQQSSQGSLSSVRAAFAMMDRLKMHDDFAGLSFSAAAATGTVKAGYIGSETLRVHVVHGSDFVETRRVLLGLTRCTGVSMLVDKGISDAAQYNFIIRPLEMVKLVSDKVLTAHWVEARKAMQEEEWMYQIATDEDDPAALYKTAFQLLHRGEYQEALEAMQQYSRANPEDEHVRRLVRVCNGAVAGRLDPTRTSHIMPFMLAPGEDGHEGIRSLECAAVPFASSLPSSTTAVGARRKSRMSFNIGTAGSMRKASQSPRRSTKRGSVMSNISNFEHRDALLDILLPARVLEKVERTTDLNYVEESNHTTVVFADLTNFTGRTSDMPTFQVVHQLRQLFWALDELASSSGVTKVKTMGDCYMAIVGAPEEEPDHASKMLSFCYDVLLLLQLYNESLEAKLELRVGINSGPVVGGIIGKRQCLFDVWGDTVNVARRMDSTGLPNCVHMTIKTHELLEGSERGRSLLQRSGVQQVKRSIDVKGKGEMQTVLLSNIDQTFTQADVERVHGHLNDLPEMALGKA
eukprot:TRINITY_DN3185_c0_g1_i2.p1 TRINITY_DN3185_c0_g1~~TRINITY_DN3185_c0_g1_i2.p1  ORF type:complete len:1826 (+),score=430.72 TRINITY_DN3185_c0_g1_i2:164-5641(+)